MTLTNLLLPYFEAMKAAFKALAERDPALSPFAACLAELEPGDISDGIAAPHPAQRRAFAQDRVLKRALEIAPPDSALAAAFATAAPHFDWSILFHGPEAPPLLRDTMHVAALAARSHTDTRPGLNAGVFVLHPDIHYPLHSHLADEVYFCISGRVEIQHGLRGAPHSIGPGEYSITPSECVHSLRTGAEPVVLTYVWSGDSGAPNWWWRQDATGGWLREHWMWEVNREWRSHGTEAIGPELLERASL